MIFNGVALLSESKSRSLGLMLLCAKYRQVSTTLCLYHQCQKIKEATCACQGYSCFLFTCLPFRSRALKAMQSCFKNDQVTRRFFFSFSFSETKVERKMVYKPQNASWRVRYGDKTTRCRYLCIQAAK